MEPHYKFAITPEPSRNQRAVFSIIAAFVLLLLAAGYHKLPECGGWFTDDHEQRQGIAAICHIN